jgi:hypothetical protein
VPQSGKKGRDFPPVPGHNRHCRATIAAEGIATAEQSRRVQLRIGREERRLVEALTERGLTPTPQHEVPARAEGHYYDLDVALLDANLAIEIHTSGLAPWQNWNLWHRTLHLIDAGWHVAYLWLRYRSELSDSGIDALVACHGDALGGSAHPYRVYDADGCLRYHSRLTTTGPTVTTANRVRTGPYCRAHRSPIPWPDPHTYPPASIGPFPVNHPKSPPLSAATLRSYRGLSP